MALKMLPCRTVTTQPKVLKEYLSTLAIVTGMTVVGKWLDPFLGYRSIAWLFLLVIMGLALFVGRGPIFLAATLSALSWDFFFEKPFYSLYISGSEDQILFTGYFVAALVLGQLTARVRGQERAERQREEDTRALYLLTQELNEADGLGDLVDKSVKHIGNRFGARLAILLPDASGRLAPHPAGAFALSEEEQTAARGILGRTDHQQGTRPGAEVGATLVPLRAYGDTEGLAAVRFARYANISVKLKELESHLDQIAMSLHRRRVREISEKAKITAESARLSKTLLDAVAHEVRTPLAAIQAAAGNLAQFGERSLSSMQFSMVGEIQEAGARLNRLIGKIMDVTRLECGDVKPKLDWHEPGDLLRAAAYETRVELQHHILSVEIAPDLPLVRMDYQLTLHALTNLLSNAARHTPENTEIRLLAHAEEASLVLAVEDDGPGIPPELLGSLFKKFSRATQARPGGVGLGLSLVKGFVEAQGGEASAANRSGGGAVFSIRLPLLAEQSLALKGAAV